MLRLQTTDNSPHVPFACPRTCNPLACLQVVALYRLMKEDLWRDRKGLPRRKERAWFAVLLVLLSLAVVIDRLPGQEKEHSAKISPFVVTPANEDEDLTASPAKRLSFSAAQPIPSRKFSSKIRPPLLEGYVLNSLAFEANQGQTDSSVKFLSRGVDYSLFFTMDEAVVVLRSPTLGARGRAAESPTPKPTSDTESSAVMRIRFVGANPAPRIEGYKELPGKINYLIGNVPKQWRTNVPTYARVRYQDVYPGISVVYYGTQGRLEYDLLIDPGVDPKMIELDFQGTDKVKIDSQGNLRLLIAGGELVLDKPRIYQMTSGSPGQRKSIAGGYVLKTEGHVGFQIGDYDRDQPLIIDPVLNYSTYLGGSGYDSGTAIAVDASGNSYVTGFTRSANFPATTGSFQTSCGTTGTCNGYFWDAFVTKLTANGQIVYSSFLGGSGNDMGKAIAVDASGSAYVAGQTFSSDFPTTAGAFKTSYNGAGDAFVAKVSPGGTSLQYSTYLGGSGTDNPEGIAVDSGGNAYVTGQTYSTDFPTAAAIQASNGGNQDSDAFVTEINSSGSALVYSTYLGGSSMDWGNGIAVDSSGNAYVVGFTRSADFPLAGSLQATCGGCPGSADAFVAELAPNGGALLHSTYLGGSGDDHGTGIAIDSDGNIYVTGFTYSMDFPITPGTYQTSLASGKSAAFVAKIAPGFSSLIFSTYLQGNSLTYGKTIAADTGNVFVAGQTFSSTFPLLNPTQSVCVPSNCFFGAGFIAELSAAGSNLIFSTYLGGSHGDDIGGIALDPSANIQVTGQAASTDFPTTNAFQTNFGGSFGDAFVAKISLEPGTSLFPTSLTFGSQSVGTTSAPQTVTLSSNGTAPLHITGISASGDFAETDSCGKGVAAGSTCTLNVTFTPTNNGTRIGTLTINDNAVGSPQTVSLMGTATSAGGPVVSLSTSSLSFGNQPLGATSTPQNFTLSNTGGSPLSIAGVGITGQNPGDFAQTNDCGTSVATGASCTFTVNFTPTASGNRSATLNITDNAGGSPQHVSLTGTGIGPMATLNPTSLSFGNQNVGTTSGAKGIQLKNTGNGALTISSIAISGTNATDFAQTNNCPSSLPPGAQCNVNVNFSPTDFGTRTASLSISDDALNAPQVANLTGNGTIGSTTTVTLSPNKISFGNQQIGSASAAQTTTLQNTGHSILVITNIAVAGPNPGDFAQTNNCGVTLAAGASCTFSVTFTPTASGKRSATLNITDNAGGSPQHVSLTGTGIGPMAILNPTSLPFGNQNVGTTSGAKGLELKNTGNSTLSISSIAISGTNATDFAQANNCPSSLPPGAHCSISVNFSPTGIGTRTASLNVSDNASNSPQMASLTGTGQ
jgi:Beta-propeller repeat/Abnormal spindle-like microcephaly-assoc'd, ASPM-SPD-2-Hydin